MQELQLSSVEWGMVQGAALLPNLLLMLIAGAWADRFDPAKILAAAQGLLTLSYVGLLLVMQSGHGNFVVLMVYAAAVGAGNAFLQPVREKFVADMPSIPLQKRVSLLSITQFVLQSVGIGVAALSDSIGVSFVISIQAAVSGFSALVFFSLVSSRRPFEIKRGSTFSDIVGSIKTVSKSPGLRQLMALIAFNGYMHMGVFLVLIPVVATRVYHYSAAEYAGLQALFVLGMVVSHTFLLRQKTVEFPGQGALFSLLYTAMVGFGLAKGPTPVGFYMLVFVWGLVAGNSAGRCRLVAQSLAGPEMRGRVMSVYQLMLFGAAPIGAMVTGVLVDMISVKTIFMVMSVSSICLFVVFMMTRTLWSVRQVGETLPEDSETDEGSPER